MSTRLFHTIILCGAALGGVALGGACAGEDDPIMRDPIDAPAAVEDRCTLPAGGCDEHCTPLPGGGCLDPCFVHTTECSPDCRQLDGSCGWPPTK